MGCPRLTCDFEPNLFLQEQGGKTDAPELSVWVNPEGAFGGVGGEVLNNAGPDGRPDPTDIWGKDKGAVINGLLGHLYYMGHNPDEAHHLRDIVKTFKEPVPWWKGWIPTTNSANSTGGLGKIYGGDLQWFVGVAGNPNTDAWRTSKANMNLILGTDTFRTNSFIDGRPTTIYQIAVWNSAQTDKLIYFNFTDKGIRDKTYGYLLGH